MSVWLVGGVLGLVASTEDELAASTSIGWVVLLIIRGIWDGSVALGDVLQLAALIRRYAAEHD